MKKDFTASLKTSRCKENTSIFSTTVDLVAKMNFFFNAFKNVRISTSQRLSSSKDFEQVTDLES